MYVKNFIYNIGPIESKIEKYSYPELSYSEYDIHIDNISEKFAQNDRKMSQGTENDKKFSNDTGSRSWPVTNRPEKPKIECTITNNFLKI